jgi:hypothetical protein
MMPVGPRLLPVKHVFGVRAGRGRWTGLSSEDMRVAHLTDSETGKALEPEKEVRFLDWSAGVAETLFTPKRPTRDLPLPWLSATPRRGAQALATVVVGPLHTLASGRATRLVLAVETLHRVTRGSHAVALCPRAQSRGPGTNDPFANAQSLQVRADPSSAPFWRDPHRPILPACEVPAYLRRFGC